MRYGFVLLLAALLVFAAYAQEEEEPMIIEHPVDVETVSLVMDVAWSLNVSGVLVTGCEDAPTIDQTVMDDALIVTIYQELPENTPCSRMLRPYTDQITLSDDLISDAIAVIRVNDAEIRLASGTTTMEQVNRVDHVIEAVELLPTGYDEAPLSLRITGFQPNSCMFPVITRVSYDTDWVRVHIFRNIPAGVRCPGESVPYVVNLPLNENIADNTAIEVNTYLALVEGNFLIDEPGEDADESDENGLPTSLLTPAEREPINIETVEVITGADSVILHVTGTHSSGCRFPVGIRQERIGTEITLEIYNAMPDMSARMCPAILHFFDEQIAIDDVFEPGDYTYRVNGQRGAFNLSPDS